MSRGLSLLKALAYHLQIVRHDAFHSGNLPNEADEQDAVQFVPHRTMERYCALLDVEVESFQIGFFQIMLEGISESTREGLILARLVFAFVP